uniref:Uncharacterized protein n=1 Tax=Glossina morsitans morsitans TaxID=37546 RepID=A0A1B0FJ47_GLOMM
IIDNNNGPLDVATDHIYDGQVIGDRNSYVFGSILDGVFEGKIITERDAYYVEHAKRYFPQNFTQIQHKPQWESMALHSSNSSIGSSNSSGSGTDSIQDDLNSDRNSYVFGSILDGVFEGKIITERDAYYVEHAKRYFPQNFTQIQHKPQWESMALHSSNSSIGSSNSSGSGTDSIQDDLNSNNKTTTTNTSSLSATKKSIAEHHDDIIKTIGFHSVIYKDAHVDDVYQQRREEGQVGGCGITDEVSQWMENIQNSAVEELPEPMSKDVKKIPKKRTPSIEHNIDNVVMKSQDAEVILAEALYSLPSNNTKKKQLKTIPFSYTQPQLHTQQHPPKKYGANDDFKYPYQKYTKEANFVGAFYDPETGRRYSPTHNDWHEHVHERVKRASGLLGSSPRREDNKNTCSLYIQTDPLIWRHIREGIADVSTLLHLAAKKKNTTNRNVTEML